MQKILPPARMQEWSRGLRAKATGTVNPEHLIYNHLMVTVDPKSTTMFRKSYN